jgi:hypothetical protein
MANRTIRIPLDLPRGSAQKLFLEHLNASIRATFERHAANVVTDTSGGHTSVLATTLKEATSLSEIEWRLEKDSSGGLAALDVSWVDSIVHSDELETRIRDTVTRSQSAALCNQTKRFFHRGLFCYIGARMDGEYWLPKFRVAPIDPDDPHPYLLCERIICIDLEVDAIDATHAYAVADALARKHAARLSLFMNRGLYVPQQEKVWVWPHTDGAFADRSIRMHRGFEYPGLRPERMPKKGEECAAGKYQGEFVGHQGNVGVLNGFPRKIRQIIRSIDAATVDVQNAFDGCARLYQVGAVMRSHFPSVELAYRVAAVEALCRCDPSAASFGEFMRKYNDESEHRDLAIQYLYDKARSAHFHAGVFPVGEFEKRESYASEFIDFEQWGHRSLQIYGAELCRAAIINWIQRNLCVGDAERGGNCE